MQTTVVELIGDCALRLHSAGSARALVALLGSLRREFDVISAVCAYDCVTVRLSPGEDLERCAQRAQQHLQTVPPAQELARCVEIPLMASAGEDLSALAHNARLTSDQFLNAFCDCEFEVAQIGFQPGFPYLSGLPAALAMSRRSAPRARVPAGSVAIGGNQAGIYPNASPGGWQLLGQTPVKLFDPLAASPCLLAAGDRVRFVRCRSTS
jgi:5-oxoprolinase (ATP-hydrolysing) subunit B